MSEFIVTSFIFGHAAYASSSDKTWRWSDNDQPINLHSRRCPKCNKYPTAEGHDPCISNLPGVEFACCGHDVEKGYIKFENGPVIRGLFTIDGGNR